MALYTKDSIEKVKDAVDMVALVGARSDLRRVGARWTGLCPFHDERTPSFSVDADHKLYHCFGCGESGDAIRFVESTEGLDFREAVELLAERCGVELQREREDPREEERRRRRERLLQLVDRAAGFYARYLWESGEARVARDYLAGRGLGEDVLRDFRVGYAPGAWDRMLIAAQRQGFSQEEIAAAGLAQRGREGGLYDRFRSRIMFPLADMRGRVLGFGARAVRDQQRPKYVNTSENEIYRKGRQLFGIDRARPHSARTRRLIVVEGYTDVLALHEAGMSDSVATMGTAVTEEQLAAMGTAAGAGGTVYLALDADRSGREAMLRAAHGAEKRGLELRVVDLPEGSDPADLIAAGGVDELERRLERSLSVPRFEMQRLVAGADLSTPEGKDRLVSEALPLVRGQPRGSATWRDLMGYLADRLDVTDAELDAHMDQLSAPAAARPAAPAAPAAMARRPTRPPSLDASARAERAFLTMCLSRPDLGRDYLTRLEEDHFSSDALRRVRDHVAAHFDDPLAELPDDDPVHAAMIKEVVMPSGEDEPSAEALRLQFLLLEQHRVQRRLRRADREQDFERQVSLARAQQSLRAEFDELMGQVQ